MPTGYKASGIGRENGPNGLDAYLEVKSMFVSGFPDFCDCRNRIAQTNIKSVLSKLDQSCSCMKTLPYNVQSLEIVC